MTVKDAIPGDVIETMFMHCGELIASGNIFRIAVRQEHPGRISAWRRFKQGKIGLYADLPCRLAPRSPSLGEDEF